MIGRVNHLAIAVPDVEAASAIGRPGLALTAASLRTYPNMACDWYL